MRAIVLDGYGGREVLSLQDVAAPVAGPEDLLVDVHHSALNRADVAQRAGGYPDPRRRPGRHVARDPGDGVRRPCGRGGRAGHRLVRR